MLLISVWMFKTKPTQSTCMLIQPQSTQEASTAKKKKKPKQKIGDYSKQNKYTSAIYLNLSTPPINKAPALLLVHCAFPCCNCIGST